MLQCRLPRRSAFRRGYSLPLARPRVCLWWALLGTGPSFARGGLRLPGGEGRARLPSWGLPSASSPSSWPPSPSAARCPAVSRARPLPAAAEVPRAQLCSAPRRAVRAVCSCCRLLGHGGPGAVPAHLRLLLLQGPRLHPGTRPAAGGARPGRAGDGGGQGEGRSPTSPGLGAGEGGQGRAPDRRGSGESLPGPSVSSAVRAKGVCGATLPPGGAGSGRHQGSCRATVGGGGRGVRHDFLTKQQRPVQGQSRKEQARVRHTGAGRAGRRGLLPGSRVVSLSPCGRLLACQPACVPVSARASHSPSPAGGALATWGPDKPQREVGFCPSF